jgi:hypothetical protein
MTNEDEMKKLIAEYRTLTEENKKNIIDEPIGSKDLKIAILELKQDIKFDFDNIKKEFSNIYSEFSKMDQRLTTLEVKMKIGLWMLGISTTITYSLLGIILKILLEK